MGCFRVAPNWPNPEIPASPIIQLRPQPVQCVHLRQWPVGYLTHRGQVKHICVSKLTTIGSDNGLSPGRHQAIIWSNAGILFNWTLGTNFSEILSEIDSYSLKQMCLKMSSGKWRPYCLGFNVLMMLSDWTMSCQPGRHVLIMLSVWGTNRPLGCTKSFIQSINSKLYF